MGKAKTEVTTKGGLIQFLNMKRTTQSYTIPDEIGWLLKQCLIEALVALQLAPKFAFHDAFESARLA